MVTLCGRPSFGGESTGFFEQPNITVHFRYSTEEQFLADLNASTRDAELALQEENSPADRRETVCKLLGRFIRLFDIDKIENPEELITTCKTEVDRTGGVVTAGGQLPAGPTSDSPLPAVPPSVNPMGASLPGVARVGPDASKGGAPENLAGQADAMKKFAFQKLRSDGLKVQADAQAAFGRGETDLAIQMLTDYSTRVRAAGLEPTSVALLLRPVDSRLEMFRVMKGQADALARERTDRREARELVTGRGAAEEQRKAEVQRLVRQYHALVQRSDLAAAEQVALQAKQLEPDDPGVAALAHMAKMTRRVREVEQLKNDKENMVYKGLNAAEQPGAFVDTKDPVAIDIERSLRSRKRGGGDDVAHSSELP